MSELKDFTPQQRSVYGIDISKVKCMKSLPNSTIFLQPRILKNYCFLKGMDPNPSQPGMGAGAAKGRARGRARGTTVAGGEGEQAAAGPSTQPQAPAAPGLRMSPPGRRLEPSLESLSLEESSMSPEQVLKLF